MKEEERLPIPLTGLEIREAEEWLIAHVQQTSFDEVASLAKHGGPLKDSKLANLNPFLCPIILPSNYPVVKLLIEDVHCRELHAGVECTLSVLRQKF